MISQYVPAGKDVVQVVLHAEASLLRMRNPIAPRPKAICWVVPLKMLVTSAPPTALRNAFMLAMAGQRCSPANHQ